VNSSKLTVRLLRKALRGMVVSALPRLVLPELATARTEMVHALLAGTPASHYLSKRILSGVTGRSAMFASINLRVVLSCFVHSLMTRNEITEIFPIIRSGHEVTSHFVHFVVSIALGIHVHVVIWHRLLLNNLFTPYLGSV